MDGETDSQVINKDEKESRGATRNTFDCGHLLELLLFTYIMVLLMWDISEKKKNRQSDVTCIII